jgi:hypothetical protein
VNLVVAAPGLYLAGAILWHSAPVAGQNVLLEKNVAARMRDGVILRADIYRPDGPGPFPALLARTPYSKNDPDSLSGYRSLAERGFVVVVQDTRGRYSSDGVARPHEEAEDGYDSVEWVASLPYVSGKVGMFGGSYLATTQLTAASLRPPHLVALFPSASYASRYDMVYPGGAFYLGDGLAWNLRQSMEVRRREKTSPADRDGPVGLDETARRLLRERWYWHVPLATFNSLELRRYHPAYFDMLAHPAYDDYWKRFDIASRHGEFDTPALHLTGWYDTLLTGTLGNFDGLRAKARSEKARKYQRLVVGPWTHARPTRESTRIGPVDFGPEAGLDSRELMVRWFSYWLAAGDASILAAPPVRLFVMGENRWRDEQEWPLARARATPFFLTSGGRANTSRGDGVLGSVAPEKASPDFFTYDPWDPVPSGETGGYSRAPADSPTFTLGERADVLVYTSAPLSTALEVTGPIELVLWVASSAPDTDFTGKLMDVFPEGTARTLSDGILRTRYRRSKTSPEPLTPGEPVEIRIDLGATSNVFLPAHRIRLEVSSSNFPRFDRNPNTGSPVADEPRLLRAEQTVFHDRERPSRLILPVVPR